MTGRRFQLVGVEALATVAGALFLPAMATLVVADLHLEKGSSLARRGAFLPPYDSRATLERLCAVIAAFSPARVVCLGDSFHDGGGAKRLAADDRQAIRRLTGEREWRWVTGNHDPDPAPRLGGLSVNEVELGPLVLRHLPGGANTDGEICGHLHPKAAVTVRGRRVSGRCFATDGERLILPAFGAYAGGLDVADAAIRGLLAWPFQVHILGHRAVHTVASPRLAGLAEVAPPAALARSKPAAGT